MKFILIACLLGASVSCTPLSGHQRSTIDPVTSFAHRAASPFLKIIGTNGTVTRDTIYSTPAVMYVGIAKKLLRCLYEDPNQCEVVSNDTGSYVNSLLIFEEHVYVGLYSGMILRCNLNEKESCINFQTRTPTVWSLVRVGKHLYAGLDDGTIIRCELNELNSCRPLHSLGSSVFGLLHFNEHIYAGLYEGEHFLRCSLITNNSCTTVYKTNHSILGLSNVGNSILAVEYGGTMWNCTEKQDAADKYCVSAKIHPSNMQYIASFNGIVYMVNYSQSIHICQWPNTECTEYANMPGVRSIAFAYSTFELQSRYVNEDSACTREGDARCPPGVTYYNAEQRAMIQVKVKDGRLYNSAGALVDTSNADEGRAGPAAIFVMEPDGTLLLSNSYKRELLYTSSLSAGKPVAGAGEMTVKNGVIQEIRACSEHYRPTKDLNRQVVDSLRTQGYTDRINSVECEDDIFRQNGSENVQ